MGCEEGLPVEEGNGEGPGLALHPARHGTYGAIREDEGGFPVDGDLDEGAAGFDGAEPVEGEVLGGTGAAAPPAVLRESDEEVRAIQGITAAEIAEDAFEADEDAEVGGTSG